MTCRNSASLRVRQSSGRVALNLVVRTLRSRTAESYANAGVRPVAITTPEHSCVGIGYRHGGRHLLSLRLPPLLLPSLALRGTIAAQVGLLSAPTPEVGYRHGRLTCYAMAKPCATACHHTTRATLYAHSLQSSTDGRFTRFYGSRHQRKHPLLCPLHGRGVFAVLTDW